MSTLPTWDAHAFVVSHPAYDPYEAITRGTLEEVARDAHAAGKREALEGTVPLVHALALLAEAEEIVAGALEAYRLRQIEHEECWDDDDVKAARALLAALRAEETP